MSLLNSGWPHRRKRLASPELNLPVNSDSDPDHTPKKDPEETSAQDPEVPSWGHPGLDTTPAPSWPGLRSLVQQLPPQDSDERYCLALGEEELAELRLFCAQRRREALGQGVARLAPLKLEECTCDNCRERLRPGEYGVFAARAGKRRCWHQACFACQACGQALINLIYFYHDGRLYCGRPHAELLRPRCPACDQLIFSPRCTEAEGRRWHENHFCCQDCAGPLGGGRYALPGGGPCCPSCFERRYSDAGSSPARTLESRASPAAPPRPPTTAPPDPSFGARSSHRASLAGALRGPPEPTPRRRWGCGAGLAPWLGEEGLCRVGDPDCAQPNAATISRATFLATAASSSLETRSGMLGSSAEQEYRAGDQTEARQRHAQGRLETPLDPKEDAPCPTCSSSSESEPEGFFLGQRLPRPWETPAPLRTGDSDTSRRHCTIC